MNRCLASRRGGRKKLLCVILAALGGAGFLALALLCRAGVDLDRYGGLSTIFVLCVFTGCAINGAAPLYYELACEWAFPRVAEGLATICVTLVNNLACLVFLLLPAAGLKPGNGLNWVVAGACLVAVVGMAKFKENYRRLAVDQGSSIEDLDDEEGGERSEEEEQQQDQVDLL